MLAAVKHHAGGADEAALAKFRHVLFVLPQARPEALPFAAVLDAKLARTRGKYAELGKHALSAELPHGALAAWVVLDDGMTPFARLDALRRALAPLLAESPQQLAIAVYGEASQRVPAASQALYCAWVNGTPLPTRKRKDKARPLKKIALYGADGDFAAARASAAGNLLARRLTHMPPNELTPGRYRKLVRELAAEHGWRHEEYDLRKLRRLGAGAFVAVAQGSEPEDAAIVRLTYAPKQAQKFLALVGKGICFDTGGHNLKPARYMHGMHEDMNGSAVALGTLLAATQAALPVKIDCWLAIAQNHISPRAYKQNDVVTALNGTTIEIVHTDAEGRMVLADTLTLASRARPDLLLDYATLTGSMITALGNRYSGVLGNRPALLCRAAGAGRQSGERVCAFPFDEDYDEALESRIADVRQCTLEGEADHILAARFLSRFVEHDTPWLHVDLAASNCKGGLGAVADDTSGFGVGFSLELLRDWLAEH